jgi:integrase
MPRKRIPNFTFNSVTINGHQYYKAYVMNADHKLVIVYGKTIEELCQKYDEAEHRTENDLFSKRSPTVKEYCEKWLLMQSANVRATTLIDYTSKVNRHIIAPLGHMKMAEVTADDIKMALVPVSKKSASVYKSINIILKCIFNSAEDSKIITYNPTRFLSSKNGGVPQKDKEALTDAQVELLLDTIRELPPYVFVMLGLYAGLRREEILALKWDCVDLNKEAPYVMVRRAWHTESNRPIILTDLKTKAARRDIAIPNRLAECLREAKEKSNSDFVIANSDGGPLSYSQFKNLWRFIVVRTAKPRPAKKKVGGKYVKYTLYPQLGEMAKNNGKVQYVLDFEVKPHQLRHTYITNLIAAGVDPKTVQYLAGHESSKITMDIYAKVKYNRPEEVAKALDGAFAQWKEQTVQ